MATKEIGNLLTAKRDLDRAREEYVRAVRRILRLGRRVTWQHGKRTRSGIVDELQAWSERVRVLTPTGKLVWLCWERVLNPLLRGEL